MEIVFGKAGPKKYTEIGSVSLDASVEEVHSQTGRATDIAVESGSDISDHVHINPRTIRITGVVSNHPIDLPGSQVDGVRLVDKEFEWTAPPSIPLVQVGGPGFLGAATGAIASAIGADKHKGTAKGFSPQFDRVQDALEELDAIQQEGRPVTVVTTLRVYHNMVIESLEVQRSARTGNILSFTAMAKQIRTVQTEVVFGLPEPKVERGKPESSRGKKPGDELGADDAAAGAGKSLAAKMVDSMGGWF